MLKNDTLRRGMSARNIRRLQRRAKGDNHTGGNLDSGADQNNSTGNTGDSGGTADSSTNNTGQPDPLAGFWADPKPEAMPAGTPAPSPAPTQDQQNTEFGQQLGTAITGLKFEPVFTDEIAAQINAGDLAGANAAMAAQAQAAVKHSLVLSARVMERYGASILQQVDERIKASLGNRDNEATLVESFPSAADPKARPLIQDVFNQALKHTGGDRVKAVALAKDMLKYVGRAAADDLGYETPPGSREDMMSGGPSALVDELLGRGG